MVRETEKVPICNKVSLTIEEAAEYSNIGQNRISELLKMPRCPFVLYVGKKKLVKRREFEQFIATSIEIQTEMYCTKERNVHFGSDVVHYVLLY